MPQKPLTDKQCLEALKAFHKFRSKAKAARSLLMNELTFAHRLREAERRGITVDEKTREAGKPTEEELLIRLRQVLKKDMMSFEEVGRRLEVDARRANKLCETLYRQGANVYMAGDSVSLESTPVPVSHDPELHVFKSDKDGRYRFGVVTDNHLCSKYAREDVLHDLYDLFAREGITRVYNAGNWIDGEARFNKFDIHTHGMTNQLEYFAKNYPQRPGITTYFVAGDDHEGWYAKNHGADIGRMAEDVARNAGRTDLRYLGYMESYISLQHAKTGKTSQLLVVHPGGGSSYAISYAPQKYVESLQGGEKPAVVIFGHWHKMDVFNYRNVWIIQGGTTEDQTPFMRKQKLEAHVGGMIVELRQDEKGAITDCIPWMKRYFDRGYYNDGYQITGKAVNRNNVRRRK